MIVFDISVVSWTFGADISVVSWVFGTESSVVYKVVIMTLQMFEVNSVRCNFRDFGNLKMDQKFHSWWCSRKTLCPNKDDSQNDSLVYFRY